MKPKEEAFEVFWKRDWKNYKNLKSTKSLKGKLQVAYEEGWHDSRMNPNGFPEAIKHIERLCFVCKKRLSVFCGTPLVQVGGCCVGVEWKGVKYQIQRKAHYGCFSKLKKMPKLVLTEKQAKRLINKECT